LLRRLSTLHIFDVWGETFEYRWLGPGLGSLSNFNRLRDLEIPVEILFGDADVASFRVIDMLPKSIARLGLRNDLVWFPDLYPFRPRDLLVPLQAFLGDTDLKTRLPKLRVLHLCLQDINRCWPRMFHEEFLTQLSDTARAVSVDLVQR